MRMNYEGIVLFCFNLPRYGAHAPTPPPSLQSINHLQQQQHIQFHFHASTLILTFQFHQIPIPISPIFSTNSALRTHHNEFSGHTIRPPKPNQRQTRPDASGGFRRIPDQHRRFHFSETR
ncbi:unnamed protein product [Trifolium pratense]|uniref:Uncharacterized protein n=1 Tax=Trifolium pratense TaxID=57577 RepID=A0ACB0JQ11_TRIPR|nr:unnamed protein product [Trifolium pratense]